MGENGPPAGRGSEGSAWPTAGRRAHTGGTALMTQLDRWVAGHRDEAVRELAGWVAQPSVSSDGTGFPAATRYGADLVRRCGLVAEVIETGGRPLIVGAGGGGHGGPHRLALRALREISGTLPGRVTVGLDGEEEIGSPNLAAAVRHRFAAGRPGAAGRPDLALWSDGPVHQSGRATVALGVRGIVTFELRATGAASPLHSGNWGGVAPNPAWRLVHLLASMRSADGRVLIEGAEAGARPL